MYYLTEPDPRGALGLGGKDERPVGTAGSYLTAIDYKTGKDRVEAPVPHASRNRPRRPAC